MVGWGRGENYWLGDESACNKAHATAEREKTTLGLMLVDRSRGNRIDCGALKTRIRSVCDVSGGKHSVRQAKVSTVSVDVYSSYSYSVFCTTDQVSKKSVR